MSRWGKVVITMLTALVMMLALNAGLSAQVPQAEADGGIVGASNAVTVMNGVVLSTAGITYTDAFESRYYGSMQVMAVAAMTGTETMTVTPQFSLQNVPCSQVSQWFTATEYVPYQAATTSAQILTNTGNMTITTSAPVATGLVEALSVTGSGAAGREVSSAGICFRSMVTWDVSNQTLTTTVVVRGLNRSK